MVLWLFLPDPRLLSWPFLVGIALIAGLHELDRDRIQPSP